MIDTCMIDNGFVSSSYPENRTQTKLYLPSKNNVGGQSELYVLITGHKSVAISGEREKRKLKLFLSILREQEREEDNKDKQADSVKNKKKKKKEMLFVN